MRIDQPPQPLDITRLKVGPPIREQKPDDTARDTTDDAARKHAGGRSRALVAYRDGTAAATAEAKAEARARAEGVHAALEARKVERLAPPADGANVPDVRHMTPREMQDYSQNLYAAGVIAFEDYEALAFQPDLHPDFGRTIGALTGETAQPDRPRDYISQWADRVEYTQRYYPQNSNEVRQAHRIHEALKAFPRRTDIFV